MKIQAQPLLAIQISRVNESFSDLEQIEAVVFVGDKDGYNSDNALAMHATDSKILANDYALRGRETIEKMINSTPSTGDINQVKPWDAKPGDMFRVVGWIAWSVDDTDFLNLEWERV